MRNIINTHCYKGDIYNLVYDSIEDCFLFYNTEKPDFFSKGYTSIESMFNCLKSNNDTTAVFHRIVKEILENGNRQVYERFIKGI